MPLFQVSFVGKHSWLHYMIANNMDFSSCATALHECGTFLHVTRAYFSKPQYKITKPVPDSTIGNM